MKYLSVLLMVAFSAGAKFPVPIFPEVSLPVPRWTTETVTVVPEKVIEPAHPHGPFPRADERLANGRIKRLPGPNWWHCPNCGSSSCTMSLGQHLRGTHRQSFARLDAIGYRNWYVYHDNLHNLAAVMAKMAKPAPKPKAKARPAIKQEATCSGCQGGRCGLFGRSRGRWR